jgi:hypothetical protein
VPFLIGRLPAAFFLVAAVLAAFFMPGHTVAAPQPCLLHDDALRILEEKYTEVPVAIGLANNGRLVEVLASEDGATWTILVTTPGGPTCMVSAGENWRVLAPEDPGT